MSLKDDLKDIPTWAWWVGGGVAVVLLVMRSISGSSSSSAAGTTTQPINALDTTPSTAPVAGSSYDAQLATLQSEFMQLENQYQTLPQQSANLPMPTTAQQQAPAQLETLLRAPTATSYGLATSPQGATFLAPTGSG